MNINWDEVKAAGMKLLSIVLLGIIVLTLFKCWPSFVVGCILGGCIMHYRSTLMETIVKPIIRFFGWTI